MARRIIDSNILISYWHKHRPDVLSEEEGERIGSRFVDEYGFNTIVTPVAIEFIAGATRSDELHAYRGFLKKFHVVDKKDIRKADWERAEQIAARIPPSGKRRHLPDCIIRAVAARLGYDVFSKDAGFPKK